jgi:hypothetical protein
MEIKRYNIDEFMNYGKTSYNFPMCLNVIKIEPDSEKKVNIYLDKLNKLSEANFDVIAKEIKESDITTEKMMNEFVSTLFNKAINEKNFISLYVNLCDLLMGYFIIENEKKISFREKIITLIQKVFMNVLLGHDKRVNVCLFVGEFYNKEILNLKIIKNCINQIMEKKLYKLIIDLLGITKNKLKKEDVEFYSQLETTLRKLMETEKGKEKFLLMNVLSD